MSSPNGHGGTRHGAGRKSNAQAAQAREAMDAAWSEASRKKSIRALARLAEKGDVAAFKVLMAYAYGTPQSGDESRIDRELTDFNNGFIAFVKSYLSPEESASLLSAARLYLGAIGVPEKAQD